MTPQGNNETAIMQQRRQHRNSDNETVTMTLQQCDAEGDTTMAMMKPQQRHHDNAMTKATLRQ